MPFDFKRLARGGAISSITDPAALFDALPNKAEGYGYLRAVQKTILDTWSPRRNERDLVIKTNTGGGKTIAGLLILQACIHEGAAPALYLAPDPHLAKQVLAESVKLGLTTVDNPESTKFLSGEAICVTTMQVLINGKSRFGLVGAVGRQPLPVRTIVIDDAHAAIALAEERTFLRIPSSHPAHGALLDMFDEDLRQQGLNALLDIREGDPTATPLRVPFWSWYDKREQVLQILRQHRSDPVFEWSWPLVADILPWCQATVGTETIEITPLCPPIEKLPSFAEADRRIYLTATLADDSVLVFSLDPGSGVPTYLQLVQQVEHALRLGSLEPGDQLPRVKDVVASLAINPNTVAKAYHELETKGLTVGRPGQGTFIQATLSQVALPELTGLRRSLLGWLATADGAGLDEDGIVALFTSALRDFRERQGGSGSRSGAISDESEGVA